MQKHIQAPLMVYCICQSGVRLLHCMRGNTSSTFTLMCYIGSFQTWAVKCYSLSFGEKTVCFMSSMYGGDEATSSASTVV